VDPDQQSPPARPLSVLVVEDHPDAARALAILLPLLCGCRVRVALSVAEALDAAAVGPFDAVLTDIGLPDGDGCDLADRLLRLLPARPLLVAITALGVLAEDRCRACGRAIATPNLARSGIPRCLAHCLTKRQGGRARVCGAVG
jgi:CheY-like chemotaxis protein